MAEMRRLTLADVLILMGIIALAAGARAGYLISCADNAQSAGPLRVETTPAELETLANNFKNNGRFASSAPFAVEEEETAHFAPGYPWLMSATAWVAREGERDRVLRWLHVVLGTLTAALYFLFARRVFRNRVVAIVAGLLCALHPFWIVDAAALADGVVATFLLAFALFLGARAAETSGSLASLLYGLSLAALALVRAALLPFAFVALAWFLWRSRTLTSGWLAALLAFLGFVIGLTPWTFRNWQLFGEPLPVIDSAYFHLWVGNNPEATGGPPSERMMRQAPVDELAKITRQTDRYGRLGDLVAQEIRDRPAETVRRRLRAGLDFVFGEHWFTEGRLADRTDSESTLPDWLARSYPVVLESTLLGLIVLALLGWRWTYAWRSSAILLALAMIWIPLPYVLSHAEALSGPRLPLDGVLLCYAAFALACLFPGRARLWAGEEPSGMEAERP